MENYKNDYTKNEDEILWEIHEIRHKLHNESKNKSTKEINDDAKNIIEEWKKERVARSSV